MAPPGTPAAGASILPPLRRLRAVAQDLRALLGDIREGTTTASASAPYLMQARAETVRLLGEIDAASDAAPDHTDSLQRLVNIWNRLSINPLLVEPEHQDQAPDLLHNISILDGLCGQLVFLSAYLTIPDRLNAWLDRARPGYYVPFHAVFDDELPSFEDRVRVLRYLAWAPRVLRQGLVDVTSGLIYRFSDDGREQARSVLLLLLALLLSAALVAGAAGVPLLTSQITWPAQPADLPVLLGVWLAALAGVAVHAAVTTAKRMRNTGELPPLLVLDDLPRVVNARLGQILLKLAVTLIVTFVLLFTTGLSGTALLQGFLSGYSLDSFLDLFSAGIEQRAAAQVSLLKQQLGLRDDPPG
jgi:hypothetical protein